MVVMNDRFVFCVNQNLKLISTNGLFYTIYKWHGRRTRLRSRRKPLDWKRGIGAGAPKMHAGEVLILFMIIVSSHDDGFRE